MYSFVYVKFLCRIRYCRFGKERYCLRNLQYFFNREGKKNKNLPLISMTGVSSNAVRGT